MAFGRVSRIARLTQLTSTIIEDSMNKKACPLALEHFIRRSIPVDWHTEADIWLPSYQ